MDCSLKPPERAWERGEGRGSKRKRGMDVPLTEPEERAPATYTISSSWVKHRNEKRKREAKVRGHFN